MARVPRRVTIHLSGYAEPFLNRSAAAMARYSRERGHGIGLFTTLVGFGLEHVEDIRAAHPDLVVIHVPDINGFQFADEKWIAHHDAWLKVGIRAHSYMSMGLITKRVEDYLSAHQVSVRRPTMLSRAGNVACVQPPKVTGPLTCSMNRWHQNVMLPNADVYLCCMDYSLTAPLGNLLRQSYDEIYEAAERYRHNIDPPENSICRKCEWAAPL